MEISGRALVFILFLSWWWIGCSDDGSAKKPEPTPVTATTVTKAVEAPVLEVEDEDDFDEMDYLDELYDKDPEELALELDEFLKNENWKKARLVVNVLLEENADSIPWHFQSGLLYVKAREKKYVPAANELEYVLNKITVQDEYQSFIDEIEALFQNELIALVQKKIKEIHALPNDEKRAYQILEILRLEMLRNRVEVQNILARNRENKNNKERLLDFLTNKMKWNEHAKEGLKPKRAVYYAVHAINLFEKLIRGKGRSFWNYYSLAYLNYTMQFFSSGLMALERAMNVADTQEQVFFALQLQELMRQQVGKGKENEIDKLSSMDLSDDMIEEFLGRFSKDLNEEQMNKVRGVIKEGVKLKEKLDISETDREKLNLLRDFLHTIDELADKEELPSGVMEKISGSRNTTEEKLVQLEEQVLIKEDAVREDV